MHKIEHEGEEIFFSLLHQRKTTAQIYVYPDESVVVSAPQDLDLDEIKRRVSKKARWITLQSNYFKLYPRLKVVKRYLSGNEYGYLGKHYRLTITQGSRNTIKLWRGTLRATFKEGATQADIDKMVTHWYHTKAGELFAASMERCWPYFKHFNIPKPSIIIRQIEQWAQLTDEGSIILNPCVIKAPTACLDYVIASELCKFKHRAGTPEFRKLLSGIVPDPESCEMLVELSLA